MNKDAFKDRERALEDEFFHRMDKKLLENLQAKLAVQAERQRLATATGFTDETLLNELVALGVSTQAVAAISLAPLVWVAWADGNVHRNERASIINAAHGQGIAAESPATEMLEHWLDTKPSPQLASAWRHFIEAARERIGDESMKTMRNTLIRQAEAVAKAAGGHLGFGAVSTEEKRVIAELKQAFDE